MQHNLEWFDQYLFRTSAATSSESKQPG